MEGMSDAHTGGPWGNGTFHPFPDCLPATTPSGSSPAFLISSPPNCAPWQLRESIRNSAATGGRGGLGSD